MAIPIEEFITPRFIRYQTRYPLSYNEQDRYVRYGGANTRHWRIEPQEGYNANNPSITPVRVNLNVSKLSFRPR